MNIVKQAVCQRFVEAFLRWIQQYSFLLLGILVVSLIQATILALGDFGGQAIRENIEQIPGVLVPHSIIFNYLTQIGGTSVILSIGRRAILLFLSQSISIFLYSTCRSMVDQRIAALLIWLLPALIALPTIAGTCVYLLSPLFTVGVLTSLLADRLDTEDFAEGIVFISAAIGCFNLFWLGATIRAWLLPQSRSAR